LLIIDSRGTGSQTETANAKNSIEQRTLGKESLKFTLGSMPSAFFADLPGDALGAELTVGLGVPAGVAFFAVPQVVFLADGKSVPIRMVYAIHGCEPVLRKQPGNFLLQKADLFFQIFDGLQLVGSDGMGGKGLFPFPEFRFQGFDLSRQVLSTILPGFHFGMVSPFRL
jgi:hypothetical protein